MPAFIILVVRFLQNKKYCFIFHITKCLRVVCSYLRLFAYWVFFLLVITLSSHWQSANKVVNFGFFPTNRGIWAKNLARSCFNLAASLSNVEFMFGKHKECFYLRSRLSICHFRLSSETVDLSSRLPNKWQLMAAFSVTKLLIMMKFHLIHSIDIDSIKVCENSKIA